jgi:hypothetical protein
MLIRLAGLKGIGLFDTRFFAYCEDVDLCMRVLCSGQEIRAVPQATCVHLAGAASGGVSSPFSLFLSTRNSWLFLRKHVALVNRPAAFCRFAGRCLETASELAAGDCYHHAAAVLGALTAIVRGRYGRPTRLAAPHPLNQLLLSWPRLTARLARALQSTGRSRLEQR